MIVGKLQHNNTLCQFKENSLYSRNLPQDKLSNFKKLFGRALVLHVHSQQQTIAITGATGLIGTRLTKKLVTEGYRVSCLTRDVKKAQQQISYPNVEFYGVNEWKDGIQGAYGVVNLAGMPISIRWDEKVKREIRSSRINVTARVVSIIDSIETDSRPQVLVSSSAVGYYGISKQQYYTEDDAPGSDYLAKVCVEWEETAFNCKNSRVVVLRNGIVLAKEGGALERMLPVFQFYAGGPIGSGTQWFSWVHREDMVNLIIQALKNQNFKGVYNATAPNPVTMRELCSTIGKNLGRPSWLPVPEFAIQALLGEGASVVLEGQKVSSQKVQQAGFQFKYNDIDSAIKDILSS